MDERIYTENKMLLGVFVGGPLAGAYYFWRTFTALGKTKEGIAAIGLAFVVLIISLGSVFVPTLDRIPNIVFWGIQLGLTLGVTRGYLLEPIARHVADGKPVFGWGHTMLVALLSLVMTLGALIAIVFAAPETFDPTTTKHYGNRKHEIVFDPANIDEADVDRIAAALTSTGFFDEEVQKATDAARSGDRFIITMYCSDEARDPEAIDMYRALRSDVQASFPDHPIVIDMVVGSPDNRIARLE